MIFQIYNSLSSINCKPLSDLGIQESVHVWCLVTLNKNELLTKVIHFWLVLYIDLQILL